MPNEKKLTTVQLILLGGFLGAGKTTLIQAMGEILTARGMRYGVITNDQGDGLIDTATAQGHSPENVAEITGGCFCCRLDNLVTELSGMCANDLPDVIFAEPVGSCTDLMATVVLPLQRIYDLPVRLAPYAVTLDPQRVAASLGVQLKKKSMTKGGGYIYRKQMEEAERHVLNKIDLLSADEISDITDALADVSKRTWQVSARSGDGVSELLDALLADESQADEVMEVDYERYGQEEAEMGWYNAKLDVDFHDGVNATEWLESLVGHIAERLKSGAIEVGHFKTSLESDQGRLRVHQVNTGDTPELTGTFKGSPSDAVLLVNLRAEASPKELEKAVRESIQMATTNADVTWVDEACFKPGQPMPTHRVAAL